MSYLKFTTVERVLAKIHRELKGTQINESDTIEYIGEALDFLKVYPLYEEAVTFQKVENFNTEMPKCTEAILQIARNRNWDEVDEEEIATEAKEAATTETTISCPEEQEGILVDCNNELVGDYDVAYYRPFFDTVWEYELWTQSNFYKQNFSPVRLSNHSFFNTVVTKEAHYDYIYQNVEDEYTIVGNIEQRLRFSFEKGYVAISYLRGRVDPVTGYPYVPDHVSFIQAISYYIKWKMQEWYAWNHRQGAAGLALGMEKLWLRYARQAKNAAKMPKSLDRYQNLLEQRHQIVPRLDNYSEYFKKFVRNG